MIRQALLGKRFIETLSASKPRSPSVRTHLVTPEVFPRSCLDFFKYYLWARPHDYGEFRGALDVASRSLPPLFWWEGPDGSRVLALHRTSAPSSPALEKYARLGAAALEDYDYNTQIVYAIRHSERCFPPGFDDGFLMFGVGNHGGGPTKERRSS